MRTKLTFAIAIAGSMLVTCLVWGSAQAISAPVPKSEATSGMITLVGGGHGGHGGHGGEGGEGGHGGPGGGYGGYGGTRGGSGGGLKLRSGPGPMSHMDRDYVPHGNYALRDSDHVPHGNYALRDRGHVPHGNYALKDHRYVPYGNRHYAMRDHDHDFRHFRHGRHGHFVSGVWVWDYGPDYYSYGDDCWWLRRQAVITGSPYWWHRYNVCVGYGYY